jgi:hypothetical protein
MRDLLMFPTKAKQTQVLYGAARFLQKLQGNILQVSAAPLFYAFAKLCTKTSTGETMFACQAFFISKFSNVDCCVFS